MGKFYGTVGFSAEEEEVAPGVWEQRPIERKYYGDIIKNNRRLENTGTVNDDISISNTISIVADPYCLNNFHSIRYVKFMGTSWKVNSVEVEYPRLILTLGGVYSGEQA